MTEAYNMDCMEAMRAMPDNAFDLAIVDPVYGDVTKGGYMQNRAGQKANCKQYNLALWGQKKTGTEYFRELQRVSKNQIIWGAIILQLKLEKIRNVGLCGTRTGTQTIMLILKLHGLPLILQADFSGIVGMGCFNRT
jgi:hypothetical protein